MSSRKIDHEQLADFAAALRPRLAGELRTDRMSRSLYATDASMYQIEPLGVLVPRHEDDVQAAITEAARFGIPVLPRGSGSSLAGSAVGAALVIDTTRHLDRVEINREEATATVGPGVVLDHLNQQLFDTGLMVGPDPASSNRATIGGMLGTNATGTHSIRYGSMVDHVRRVTSFLPTGDRVEFGEMGEAEWQAAGRRSDALGRLVGRLDDILESRGETISRDTPPHWRRAGGYRVEHLLNPSPRNLAALMCGSEGTLGFASEIEIGLVERPKRTALGVAHFTSRTAALEAVVPVLETEPSAVELFDRVALQRAREVEEYRPKLHFVQGDPAALLIVEYTGESTAELAASLDRLAKVLGPRGVLTRCDLDTQIRDVWEVRKVGLGLSMSARLPVQCLPFIEDAAVPVERLAEYIERLEAVLAEHGSEAVMYAHASAGCLHVRPFLDVRNPEQLRQMAEIASASAELVREFGGIISSEHGDGLVRSWLAPSFYGEDLYQTYVEVKRAFDPEGRFNPGRVVEAPPMTENLRVDHPLQVVPLETEMDWSAVGGLAGAAEACNGQAVCRKRLSGTMCPSFMVTRDEKDSTRGRANALRNVFSGALPPESLHDEQMQSVMDLCISCKACRAECPAAVDMAAMKAEWLSMRWKKESPPLRTKMIARQPDLSRRVAGPLAPITNAALKTSPARAALRKIGLSDSVPAFARDPFHEREVGKGKGDRVVLYADTWARFHEPEVPRAAVSVLRRAGFSPVIPKYACCGRTLISKGFLSEAREKIRTLVDVVHPLLGEGVPFVGLEPSCILTLRDEATRLLPNDERVQAVMAAAMTFEEFVVAHGERFSKLVDGDTSPRAMLHAHCHQKALSGVAPGFGCLETAGFEVEALDAGCCGMAGSFGYEAEHEETSRAMAERVLAPAVREADDETVVVASGTSCRHQIERCVGRSAVHPAVALLQQLGNHGGEKRD